MPGITPRRAEKFSCCVDHIEIQMLDLAEVQHSVEAEQAHFFMGAFYP